MPLILTTPPASDIVTIAEAKDQLRVTTTDQDVLINRLIDTATRVVEQRTGVRLFTQTVTLVLDGFPKNSLDLGVYPVNAVNSVKYDDADNVEQTLVQDTDYWVQLGGMFPVISPVTAWPTTKARKPGCVRIEMLVGYSTATEAPEELRHAVLLEIERAYSPENFDGDISMLIEPYRRVKA